ncbi:MAG: hypothetical protein Q8K30_01110 [Candidatus Gracilibacteria bacterium]|nr:hypothetical protein [Candidatus Gracilibacteria bacterium]
MNTQSLQEMFPEVYRDFYSRNPIVLSGCYVFPWGPMGGKHISHSIRVKSKIPLKCYVGFNKNSSGKITFGLCDFYDISNKNFIRQDFSIVVKEFKGVCDILDSFLTDNDIVDGCEISVLSETSRGHSFGLSGTLFAVLVSGLFEIFGLINFNKYSDYTELLNSEIINDIFKISLSLELKSRYGNTIGQNILSTLSNYREPTVLISEMYGNEIKNEEISNIFRKHILLMSSVENYVTKDISLDFGMIFPGISGDTKQVEQYKVADKNLLNDYKISFSDFLNNFNLNNKKIYLKDFVDSNIDIYNHIADTIGILNFKTVYLFQKMAKSGYRDDIIDDFIYHVNQYRYALSLLENQNSFAEDFIFYFRKNRSHSDEKIGIMPTASGKIGGGYVIVTKLGLSRNTLEKTISDLRYLYPNIEVEYSSFIDGSTNDGIILEQSINKGIFSQYINRNLYVYSDNLGINYFGNYEEIFVKETNGVLLDTISNKIYIYGKKLTSKDIHSQNATIEILSILLNNLGKNISNHDLPLSSYSKNKNEMVGKIVIPFLKLIENNFNIKLDFECKGGITDFYLKLEKIDIKIGKISRI